MAFFSEVKAKLGLDISPFERGLRQAQNSAGGLAKGLGKQFASTEKLAGALAAAVGLNMQSIADNIARFFTGFSKEAEESLENLVAKTEDAARKQEAALDAAAKRRKQLEDELAKRTEQRRISRLSDEQRENELIAERDRLRGVAEGTGTKAVEARLRLLDIEEELARILDSKIAKQVEANAEFEKERAAKEAERKAQTEWLDGIIEATERELQQAEEKRLETLRDQKEALEGQREVVKNTLAAYASAQRKSLLPTTEDVRSGRRNIGSGARRQATELERSQARAQRLSDAEQRKREELANPNLSEGDRRRIVEEGRKLQAEKEAELSRSERLKGGLAGRVSDIDTNKQSLEELQKIEKGIADLNDKLKPKNIKS